MRRAEVMAGDNLRVTVGCNPLTEGSLPCPREYLILPQAITTNCLRLRSTISNHFSRRSSVAIITENLFLNRQLDLLGRGRNPLDSFTFRLDQTLGP